ncbi:hypothetical protein CcaCcLH18_05078 [Colletotrichum camelliae]|nr:hypothetical protein CcaCcLH18_05078 [Colletotrichum camelliae]
MALVRVPPTSRASASQLCLAQVSPKTIMSVDSRLKRADEGITQGMTNRLNKLIRDTEDIRRKTLESALADMPLDFEEHERPWVVERIKDSFRVHFSHIHYDTLDGCPLVSYHLGRDKPSTFQESVSYLEGTIRTDDFPASSHVDPTQQQLEITDSVSEPPASYLDPDRPKRQLRRSDVSDERPRKKARLPSRGADVNRPVRRYIVESRYRESWIFSYVTDGVQEHFILRCPVPSCLDRNFSQDPIESGCGITHLRDHDINVVDEDDLVHSYARRMIIRDESETGSISQLWVDEHNKAIGELYDTRVGEDRDSKSNVDEDIDELGQDTSHSPRVLGSVRSEFEKTDILELSVLQNGGLGN